MTQAAELPAEAIAAIRLDPAWAATEAIAQTLVYEAELLGFFA